MGVIDVIDTASADTLTGTANGLLSVVPSFTS
jgi:hypothetical protein